MASNEELQAELDELRQEVRQLQIALTHAVATPPQQTHLLTRRNLLRAAPVAALGAGISALAASPAAAAAGAPVLLAHTNDQGLGATTTITGGTVSVVPGTIPAGNTLGQDIPPAATIDCFHYFSPETTTAKRVRAGGDALRLSVFGPGVGLAINAGDGFIGTAPNAQVTPATGISVVAQAGNAIHAAAEGVAIDVESYSSIAIAASTDDGQALAATSNNTAATKDAVTVAVAGKGRGLYAESTNASNVNGTITAVNDGAAGIGLWGEQRGTTGAGFGVVAVGGKLGRGARLSGGAANVQMLPSPATTHPTTGKAGDFFVDSTARLWYCQKPSTSTVAATWKQLA